MKLTFAVCQQAISLRNEVEVKFLQLGKCLSEIEKQQLWKGHTSSFGEFVEQEMRMSKATVSKLISVYDTYVLRLSFTGETLSVAGYSNLYTAIPLLKEGNEKEIVEKVVALGRSGIEVLVREGKYGEHVCEPNLEVCFYPCTHCKKFIRA